MSIANHSILSGHQFAVQQACPPVICDIEIITDPEGRFCLNSLHRASGGDNRKRPSLWLTNKQAQELIEELSRNSCLGQEVIKTLKGGINPGTFAHELLAVEYAGWISPAFRLKVNQTFIDYRSGRLSPSPLNAMPQTFSEALRLAADLAEEKERLVNKVQKMEPDVHALHLIAKADGSLTITSAAKHLQVQPSKLFEYLCNLRWIYKRPGGRSWLAYQERIQAGYLEHKVTTIKKEDGSEKVVEQVLIKPKGLSKLASFLVS
ncbi:DNA-binding protein [Salmonella enterica]|nr:DNA-binding protein [Salmonella enterica]